MGELLNSTGQNFALSWIVYHLPQDNVGSSSFLFNATKQHMKRKDSLEKIRTASVAGSVDRRSSLVLVDQMARIGGQAAAVARMTEEDCDMDNLERCVIVIFVVLY